MPVLPDSELDQLSKAELIAIIRRLEAHIAAQDLRIAALEEAMRDAKRAKAPFSKGKRKDSPKKPGRKPGQGLFKNREEPAAGPADQTINIEVPLPDDLSKCPECGGPLTTAEEIATVEDMPEVPKRIIKRFTVEVGRCPLCGWNCRGTHPDLSPSQNGANAHQIGPQVKAQALSLHYLTGLPLCKVPGVILQTTGIRIGQSALTQLACNLTESGGLLAPVYTKLREQVANSPVVNTDDTGWRINATLAFVMGFFTADAAYFQIRYRHRHQEVLEALPIQTKGKKRLMGTDRGKSYDAGVFNEEEMQKCLSHLLENLSKVEETKTGEVREFTTRLKALLREGLALWNEYKRQEISRLTYRRRGKKLQKAINEHLRDRELSDADNQRLLDGIGHQEDRGRVTLFLRRPEIEPTNNRAERGLRPAVIARKVSHCSKTDRGALAYATLKSIFVTLTLRTKSVVNAFKDLLDGKDLDTACGR